MPLETEPGTANARLAVATRQPTRHASAAAGARQCSFSLIEVSLEAGRFLLSLASVCCSAVRSGRRRLRDPVSYDEKNQVKSEVKSDKNFHRITISNHRHSLAVWAHCHWDRQRQRDRRPDIRSTRRLERLPNDTHTTSSSISEIKLRNHSEDTHTNLGNTACVKSSRKESRRRSESEAEPHSARSARGTRRLEEDLPAVDHACFTPS
jgi:hypothetical protein